MGVDKQQEFVWSQLKASAESVGIDIDMSGSGLSEIFSRLGHWELQADQDDVAEAERLLSEFGSTDTGMKMLYALGEAYNFADGWTWAYRDLEPKWENEDELKLAGWGSLEERTLCDFAMYTGIAAAACQAYCNRNSESKVDNIFSHLGRKGAVTRHAPMRNLRDWAVSQYKTGNWRSANAAAHALTPLVIDHGKKIGAFLTQENAQRTIAEWFRKYV